RALAYWRPQNVAGFARFARARLSVRLESGIKGHAAVDEQGRPVDVIRVVRRKPHRGAADVLRLADPAIRDELEELPQRLRRAPRVLVDRRADRAGRDAVHADAEWRNLLGDGLHHHHHAAFGRGIVHVPGPRDDLVHRADADDLAQRPRYVGAAPAPAELT